jgi:hypothetical protein
MIYLVIMKHSLFLLHEDYSVGQSMIMVTDGLIRFYNDSCSLEVFAATCHSMLVIILRQYSPLKKQRMNLYKCFSRTGD